MTKDQFTKAIDSIRSQYDYDRKRQERYPNHYVTNGFINLLTELTNDTEFEIDYFIHDLNFGRSDNSTAAELYDKLMSKPCHPQH